MVINTEFSLLAFQKQPVGVHMQMLCKYPRRRELLFFCYREHKGVSWWLSRQRHITCHYDVLGFKPAHVAIPRLSYLYIHSPTITQREGRREEKKTEEKMFKTLDERKRHGEWEARHVISKVNPSHCWLLIRGSVWRRRQKEKDKE